MLERALRWTWGLALLAVMAVVVSAPAAVWLEPSLASGRFSLDTLNPISIGHLGVTLSLISAFRLVANSTSRTGSFVLLVSLGLGMFVAGMAASRGPFVSFMGGILILALAARNVRRQARMMVLWAAIIVASIWGGLAIQEYLGFQAVARVQSLATGPYFADLPRLQLISDAWKQFLGQPLLGSSLDELGSAWYPHNLIVESFMATGILGGGAFVVLVVGGLIAALRISIVIPQQAWVALLYVQYFLGAQFSGALYTSYTMWALLALVVTLHSAQNYSIANGIHKGTLAGEQPLYRRALSGMSGSFSGTGYWSA
ncbi:O-antigen ligase family protein [Gemmatimonadota bacterium]